MIKLSKSVFFGLVLTLIVGLTGCGNRHKQELNHLLLELADGDQIIDHSDWMTIESFLDAQKNHFKEFYDGDRLNAEAVKTYVADFFEHRRPARTITFIGVGEQAFLRVNFYLERSGSMIAYDAPQGDGSFKAAIVQMLNNLPGGDNRIFVVNSTVSAYPQGAGKFLEDSNIFEATKGIGDPGYTDFGKIFDTILNKTGDNELSILVTDMIYSTRSMSGINPQKVFAEAQGMTNAVFKDAVKKKSMLIVKMRGSYNGAYYPYDSPSRGVAYNGYRPYYIILVGSNKNIARLTVDNNYASFSQFFEMRGYENEYLFETSNIYRPYYSLLLNNPDLRGRFQPERGQDTQITRIENVETDHDSGDIRLALAVDLSKMLIDRNYLTDVRNYQVASDDVVRIKEIRPVSGRDITPAEKKYIGRATHIFILEMKDCKHNQNVSIRLLNRLPGWVAASSSDDDTRIGSGTFATTTFGLKYLLQGIYNSYHKNAAGEPYYFELELKLSK